MQVIFIHHSCFLIEADQKVFIFDYFGGEKVNGFHFHGKIPDYQPDTPIYMFASHNHADHFDPEILNWAKKYTNIHYILSKDIELNARKLKKMNIDPEVLNAVTWVVPHHTYRIDDLTIETLKSSETGVTSRTNGVAFYVTSNGISLFHSGDLGDWVWEGVGELMNGRMTRNFRSEIHKISGKPINLAFVPMDPRQGENMYRSVDYVLNNTNAEYIFPMHMWQNYQGILEYKKRISNRSMAERIIDITRENQVFPFGD